MSKIRHYTHRKDDNHDAIIRKCRQVGLLVIDIHNGDLADIQVQRCGVLYLFEIKSPGKREELTPTQIKHHKTWKIHVVESAEEIFKIVGLK
jgi:hypothetical protein